MELAIVAMIEPRVGQEEAVGQLLAQMVSPTHGEPGNLDYKVFRSLDGRGYMLYERYVDAAAHQAHRDSEHYRTYAPQIMGCLARPIVVRALAEQIPVPDAATTPDGEETR